MGYLALSEEIIKTKSSDYHNRERPTFAEYYALMIQVPLRPSLPSSFFHDQYARISRGSSESFGPNEMLKMEISDKVLSGLEHKGFIIEDAKEVRAYILKHFELLSVIEKFASRIEEDFGNSKKRVLKIWQSKEDPDDKCLAIRIFTSRWQKDYLKFVDELYNSPESSVLSESDGWIQVGFDHGV